MNKEEYLKNIERLQKADNAYYNSGNEIMSNYEYDALRDEVAAYESKHPEIEAYTSNHVGAEVVSELKRVKHEFPALSLDKTKDIDKYVSDFEKGVNKCGNDSIVLMWKMDGSTVVATYEDGNLVQLATRGNGEVGSDITHNAPYIKGLPMHIKYKGKLIVRGEAVMSYTEFNRINGLLPSEEQYKNPRNLANATISMLDSNEMRKREIQFFAFELTSAVDEKGERKSDCMGVRFNFLDSHEFQIVPYCGTNINLLKCRMTEWEDSVENFDYPVDGLVCCLNDIAYAESLPSTGHNPNIMAGYAFKWADEEVETTLRNIEWSASRTGLLNPVAVFDSVELEGTTVSRASLHNLSYIEKTLGTPYVGQKIYVYKANKSATCS